MQGSFIFYCVDEKWQHESCGLLKINFVCCNKMNKGSPCMPLTPCQDLCKILISRIMEESGLKMGQDLSQVWSMQDFDMVEPWYTQDPDIIKLWCIQDPYKDQYTRFLHG